MYLWSFLVVLNTFLDIKANKQLKYLFKRKINAEKSSFSALLLGASARLLFDCAAALYSFFLFIYIFLVIFF